MLKSLCHLFVQCLNLDSLEEADNKGCARCALVIRWPRAPWLREEAEEEEIEDEREEDESSEEDEEREDNEAEDERARVKEAPSSSTRLFCRAQPQFKAAEKKNKKNSIQQNI